MPLLSENHSTFPAQSRFPTHSPPRWIIRAALGCAPFWLAHPAQAHDELDEDATSADDEEGVETETNAQTPVASPDAPVEQVDEPPQEVVIRGSRRATSASESSFTSGELMMRPRRRPGDLVEVAPGLISVQHAGGGKANQYFLRGFDIDHGTDLALYVDQMPVNMPSHGHGQGYADLHFVIPETVAHIDVHKGPYYAQFGDFATAGALQMKTMDRAPENVAAFQVGQYGILRGLGLGSVDVTDRTGLLLAGEVYAQNGPFENKEKLQRFNAFAKLHHDLSPTTTLTATWMSYASKWNASGQIPLRAVEDGQISRFGYIDPSEGGSTQRHSASLDITSQFDDWALEATVYGIRYDFRLYSNFTFYLDDPIHGDEIEQTDGRNVFGTDMHLHGRKIYDWVTLETTAGIQARHDAIENGLYHDQSRQRLDTRVAAHVAQTSIGFYVEEKAQFFPWLTIEGGLRFDRLQVGVTDQLDDPTTAGNTGDAAALLVSPKFSLVLSPLGWLDMYVNFGRGFHSNDARGATRNQAPADLLVPATGYEVGARVVPWRALELTAAAYRLDLASEQVYVGDEGTTEPSDRSTRYGVEFTGELHLGRYLSADAALTLNRAQYRPNEGNGGAVALAPTRTLSAGISGRAAIGSFGSLRLRSVGPRPATSDGSIEAQGWAILSASVGHRQGPFELRFDVDNLLNQKWREVQFATTSQLRNETAPVTEIHFAPGWPLTARGTLTAYF